MEENLSIRFGGYIVQEMNYTRYFPACILLLHQIEVDEDPTEANKVGEEDSKAEVSAWNFRGVVYCSYISLLLMLWR